MQRGWPLPKALGGAAGYAKQSRVFKRMSGDCFVAWLLTMTLE